MPQPVAPHDRFDARDCNTNEDNCDKFISFNSTDFKYVTIEKPILFLQKHLNHLTTDLCLCKKKAELLASRLKNKMVEKDVKVSYYRKQNREFCSTIKVERPLCY